MLVPRFVVSLKALMSAVVWYVTYEVHVCIVFICNSLYLAECGPLVTTDSHKMKREKKQDLEDS